MSTGSEVVTAGLVAVVRHSVTQHAPIDARERRSRLTVLAMMDRLARPLDRNADSVHVTGSAVVVGPRGVLLHRHRRLGIWIQPGGHLDPGESPWAAAQRETLEETGLEVLSVEPIGPSGPPLAHLDVHDGGLGHTHLDLRYLFSVAGDDDTPAPPAGESPDVEWYSWADAVAIADPGLVGILTELQDTGADLGARWTSAISRRQP